MRLAAQLAFVFSVHVAFLFWGYASHFFELHLPYNFVIIIWLGLSSIIAGFSYSKVLTKSRLFQGILVNAIFAVAATCISLYVGVFLAFNIHGT